MHPTVKAHFQESPPLVFMCFDGSVWQLAKPNQWLHVLPHRNLGPLVSSLLEPLSRGRCSLYLSNFKLSFILLLSLHTIIILKFCSPSNNFQYFSTEYSNFEPFFKIKYVIKVEKKIKLVILFLTDYV